MRLVLVAAAGLWVGFALVICGCSTPSFALVTIVLPGGKVNVGQVNENAKGTEKESAIGTATAIVAEEFAEKAKAKGEQGSTTSRAEDPKSDKWVPLKTE